MDCQTLNYRRLDLTMITHTSYRLEDTQFSVHTSESVSKQQSVVCVRTANFFFTKTYTDSKHQQYSGVHAHHLL